MIKGRVNWPLVQFLSIKYLKYDNESGSLMNWWLYWNECSWIHQSDTRYKQITPECSPRILGLSSHDPSLRRNAVKYFPKKVKRKGEQFPCSSMLERIDLLGRTNLKTGILFDSFLPLSSRATFKKALKWFWRSICLWCQNSLFEVLINYK